jgi:hypothetical protein
VRRLPRRQQRGAGRRHHNVLDAHYIDTDSDGPETASGYRQLRIQVDSVDVSRTVDADSLIIDFTATDEDNIFVKDLFEFDGRFTIVRLRPAANGNASFWESFLRDSANQPTSCGWDIASNTMTTGRTCPRACRARSSRSS